MGEAIGPRVADHEASKPIQDDSTDAILSPRQRIIVEFADALKAAIAEGDLASARIAHAALGLALQDPPSASGEVVQLAAKRKQLVGMRRSGGLLQRPQGRSSAPSSVRVHQA